MKGRRKLRTHKWQMKAAFEAEARELLANRSANQMRFLDAAHHKGRELEPIGWLAGEFKKQN
jgi:hypothetical protein